MQFRRLKPISNYKDRFGGGSSEWASRGESQLQLLQWRGLQPNHTLLDVGCGPLRGGEHIIKYLNPNNYYGIDCNNDFINYAIKITKGNNKSPHFKTTCTFEAESFSIFFDFIFCFSVLNHCTASERKLFLQKISKVSHKNTKLIITHMTHSHLKPQLFKVNKIALPSKLKMDFLFMAELNLK